MTDSPTAGPASDIALLSARLKALEEENARLSAASGARVRPEGGRWRAFASALCIVVAALLVPISIVGAWARAQIVEEDAFVQTLAPLVDDPAVQQMIIDETMAAITAEVDFEEITGAVFAGIAELGLPPRAVDALALLQAPAASGLEDIVGSTVATVIESDAFSDVWATTTRGVHRALVLSATSDGGGLVVRTPDGVGIQLSAVVERVKLDLVDRGIAVADLIPGVDRVVILGDGERLSTLRTAYALTASIGFWLPFVTLGLLGAGILLARRRSTAVVGSGVALALGGGSLAVGLTVGATAMGVVAGELDLSPDALDVIYGRLVDGMAQTAAVLALIGLLIVAVGWLMGGSGGAASVRSTVHDLNASARSRLRARGLDTGRFGAWLGRRRLLVRGLIGALAVLWLFALRPYSLGDVVLVVVTALAAAWILEVLQIRADDTSAPASDAAADALPASEAPAPPVV